VPAFSSTTDFTASPKVGSVLHVDVAENAGSPGPARVLLRNGGASGQIQVDIRLAASESKHVNYSRPALYPGGVYVEVASGTVRGAIQPGWWHTHPRTSSVG
jgi:hypothetical protein